MKFVKITKPIHLSSVKRVFFKIFPEERNNFDFSCYKDSINKDFNGERLDYWLITEKDNKGFSQVIGLTGIYSEDGVEAWLGWFGVVPDWRRKGYGEKILRETIKMMKDLKYKFALLYTEKEFNQNAIKLYEKVGFKEEKTHESKSKKERYLTMYSYNLTNENIKCSGTLVL